MYKNLKSNRHCNISTPSAQLVEGSTLTIPNLAPTILELLQSSLNGDALPLTSSPLYDEDDNSGIARVNSFHDISDLKDFAESERFSETSNLENAVPNSKEGGETTSGVPTTDANN